MLVDVHVSPRELSPKALAQAARSAGLHGVVIADTHRTDRLDAYAEALREVGLAAFAGVELLLERGSLVYLPASVDKAFRSYSFAPAGGRFDWRDAMDRLKDLDGVVLAGHPYCRDLESVLADAVYFLGRLDGIETRVGKGRALWDQLADEAVDRRKVARVGSCGGDPKSIGKAMTFFHGERLMQADLVAALREGNCWPVELEAPGQAREREEAAFDGPPPRRDDDGDGERRPRRDRDGDRGPRRDRDGDRGPRRERDGDRGPRRERDGERRPRREHEDERPAAEVSAPAPVVSAEPAPAPKAEKPAPAPKAEKPAAKPAAKTEKPAPAPKAEKPAAKPAAKAEKPAPAPKAEKPVPAPKAEKPAPKAEKPAPKAEKPAPKAEKPAAKPAAKAEKPAAKPAAKAEKPAAKTAAKPEKPAAKPAKPKAKG